MGEGVADGVISKIVLLSWSPDVAKTKTKMVYSRARQLLKEQLDGIQVYFFLDIAKFTHIIPFS